MKKILMGMVCLAAFACLAPNADAGVIYMRSTVGPPWGETTNEQAMDAAFGVGGWDDLRYETATPAAVFSAANSFAFLEGGDNNANELEAFLVANLGTIEGWVAGGGSLFVNAAPNEGDGMSYGFGGVNLTNGDFSTDPVSAVNPAHPIFVGPNATLTSFDGSFFAHASVSGPGLTALMTDSLGKVHLAEKSFGMGHAIFGGMTTTNFHDPEAEALNLRTNLLIYGAGAANQNPVVPEPTSFAVFGIAALGLVGGGRRRRKA